MASHKEPLLSPALSAQHKQDEGRGVFSNDLSGAVADFPANSILFAFALRPQVPRVESITLLHSRHDYSQHQAKSVLL